jgi:hypothetical protein
MREGRKTNKNNNKTTTQKLIGEVVYIYMEQKEKLKRKT